MTFRTAVERDGFLQLGEAAERAGFTPGQHVEVIVTRSGALIVARNTDPILSARYVAVGSSVIKQAALKARQGGSL